jgi:hypothetical protein
MPQHLAAKGIALGFGNCFYKKSDRHPDQRNLVSPRELPEILAKISRRYGDSLPKPCLTWTEAIFVKKPAFTAMSNGGSCIPLISSHSSRLLLEPSEKTVGHLITCILLSSKGTA